MATEEGRPGNGHKRLLGGAEIKGKLQWLNGEMTQVWLLCTGGPLVGAWWPGARQGRNRQDLQAGVMLMRMLG